MVTLEEAGNKCLGKRVKPLTHFADLSAVGVLRVGVVAGECRRKGQGFRIVWGPLPVGQKDAFIVTEPGPKLGPVSVTDEVYERPAKR